MANQTSAAYQSYLQAIWDWAAAKRAAGNDPYAMTSGNGNQGLDALLAQRGIALADFNQGAIEQGIAFTTGTAWLKAYVAALQGTLGIGPAQPATYPNAGSSSVSSDWLLYGGVALAAVLVLPKLLRRR